MASNKTIGIMIGVGAAYFLLKKKGQATGSSSILTAPSAGPMDVVADRAVQPGAAPVDPTAGIIMKVGGSAAAVVGAINPVAGAAVGAATVIGATIYSLFASAPPDPVRYFLVVEMPFAYGQRNNVPAGQQVYALDRYGYIWPVKGVAACGFYNREVVAVNWKVFSMLQAGSTQVCGLTGYDPMPRPADPSVLRATLGNDIQFYTGTDSTLHGPWEGRDVQPAPGTPAMWAQLAGSYQPTIVASPGEW